MFPIAIGETGGNMSSLFVDLGRVWLEWRGKRKAAPQYNFLENEIVSPSYQRKVSILSQATYLNLHPTHFAVAIAPNGRMINLKGGYNLLAPGKYNIYYIDGQDRVNYIHRTTETTTDGFRIAMELVINYRVIDPIKALEIQDPVDTFLSFIKSDLKEFIRSHKYHEIIYDNGSSMFDNERVVTYIKGRHIDRSPLSKLFYIKEVAVKEKYGDPKVIDARENYRTNKAQFDNQESLQNLNEALEKRVEELEKVIQRTKLESTPNVTNDKGINTKVFISYSKIKRDSEVAYEIYKYLHDLGCRPWMDVHNLIPGQDRKLEIQKNIRNSDLFIAILSNTSVSREGSIHQELKEAYDRLAEVPEGEIFVIPIRIDECSIPETLKSKQWLDWSLPNAKELLRCAIELKED
jgi:hypothetical protein